MKHLKISLLLCLFGLIFFIPKATVASSLGQQYVISGKTMGTFYKVKFISTTQQSSSIWKKKIDVCLKDINKKMSMYDPKSELSLFNRHKAQETIHVSPDFFSILVTAQKLHRMTNGAWDGTIKPLVDLWGFGTKKNKGIVPDQQQILKALSNTGFKHILITPPYTVQKNKAVTLDLGSIAKGYGVDKIAHLFISSGIQDILIEIGGELYASGKNRKGKNWTVGISRPDKTYANQSLHTVLRLNNQAIATSGDYRNFFEKEGKTYSHVIDPKTGFPIRTKIASASVISQECTFADGLATALMVMDVQAGLDLVNRLENTECLIITKEEQGLASHTSKNFNQLMVQ